tara:strand:+ start:444 stop:1430 length:987 start_codon:yes stop_codon:yes gene_type:complete
MPTTILASRYNNLRSSTNFVLGTSDVSAPNYGYGQALTTSSVIGTRAVDEPASASKIEAQNYENLYIDLMRVRSHQVGSSVAIANFVIGDYEANTETVDLIEESYVQGLESLATNIVTDRLVVDAANLDVASIPAASSTRPASFAWSSQLSHIFTITFDTVVERRHFFNAGGEIRLSASVDYTGSQAKTVDWQSILNSMGSTSFKAENTTNNAAVGTGSSIGNYDLSNSYKLVYSRSGGSVYARNRYNIYAKEYATGNATSAIQFKVDFVDGAPNNLDGYGIDELVYGSFNSIIESATPNSQIAINGTVYDAVVIDIVPAAALIRPLS